MPLPGGPLLSFDFRPVVCPMNSIYQPEFSDRLKKIHDFVNYLFLTGRVRLTLFSAFFILFGNSKIYFWIAYCLFYAKISHWVSNFE